MSKTLGIIVAMSKELEMLMNQMHHITQLDAVGYTFYCGYVADTEVVAMQCGIGKVNAAVGTMLMISQFAPDMIINTGIAGGTGAGADILDVVLATDVAYHDVWCGPGTEPGQVQGLPERFPCAINDIDIEAIAKRCPDGRVIRGLIASGDMFISTPEQLQAVLEVQPQAVAVDMESGAIAQVCYLRGVPFIAVRVVSDTPGAENHLDQYTQFWDLAPQQTFRVLNALIANL